MANEKKTKNLRGILRGRRSQVATMDETILRTNIVYALFTIRNYATMAECESATSRAYPTDYANAKR